MPKHLTIILKPSHACNFHCPYCYDRFQRAENSKIMPKEKCVEALQNMINIMGKDTLYCVIGHGGEPTLLGPEYLDYVMSHFKDYRIQGSIQSNGSLIARNEDYWFKIIDKYHLHFGMSGDGVTSAGTRLPQAKRDTLDIIALAEMFNKHQQTFGTLMTVTPQNASSLILTYETTRKYNFSISFNPLFGEGINKYGYLQIASGLLELFDYVLQQEDGYMERPYDWLINLIQGKGDTLCEHGWCANKWIGISPDGTLFQCGKPWPKETNMGNIFDNDLTLDKIINSDFSKSLNQFNEEVWEKCEGCPGISVCLNGCPYNSLDVKTNKFQFNEDYCFYSKFLGPGLMRLINEHCENGTLKNKEIIAALHNTNRGDLYKGRNYKYPTI